MTNDRLKASDVFRNTDYLFSQKVGFKEAFPEIKSGTIIVEETGNLRSYHFSFEPHQSRYDVTKVGEYIDCSNPMCYNGGFSIGQILRELVYEKKTHFENSLCCRGYEGSPKGKNRYRSCANHFKVVVDIEYFPVTESSASKD